MTAIETLPDTLTTREVANLLGASVRTIQLWVEDGRLKAWKTPGGHRRVLRTSVEEMMASRQRVSLGNLRKYEVLVVEQDPVQRVELEKTLSSLGQDVRVRVSADGYEALLWIGQIVPDLLVTNLAMPGLDGFRLLKTLTRERSNPSMQIVVLTAMSPQKLVEQGDLPNGVMPLHQPIQMSLLLSLAKNSYLAWQIGIR